MPEAAHRPGYVERDGDKTTTAGGEPPVSRSSPREVSLLAFT